MRRTMLILLGLGGCAHVTAAKYIYNHRTQIKCVWVHGLHECGPSHPAQQHQQTPAKPEEVEPVIQGADDHLPMQREASVERFEVFALHNGVYEFSGVIER
jgi:hypothetical protein